MAVFTCFLWLMAMSLAKDAEGYCLSNIALGKPANQSVTWHNGVPERAVDGNGDPNYYGSNSCTFSHLDTSVNFCWWQVDLQWIHNITAITITNRADGFVWRLNNIDVEIFTTDPSVDQGAIAVKCFTFPGPFGPVTRTLKCDKTTPGRYVRVKKNTFDTTVEDALILCEVAVHPYIEEPRDRCDSQQERPIGFIPHYNTLMATAGTRQISASLMSCMSECFWQYACDGFNFNGTGHGVGLCEFVYVSLGKTSDKTGWTYYEGQCAN